MTGRRLTPLFATVALLAGAWAPAAAAPPSHVERMAGEQVLTETQQRDILASAPVREADRRRAMFGDPDLLPVAYARASFDVTTTRTGRIRVVPKGTGGRYDLYLSIAVARLSGSGYRWVIASYAEWRGSGGIDPCNRAEDSISTSWSDALALLSDNATGRYRSFAGSVDPLDIYRSDASPKLGVGWSFHELKQRGSQICTNMHWAEGDAYVSQSAWKNDTANAVMKYFHTKGTASYSLGFSAPGGVGTSISISPVSNQWSAAAFASFSH